MLVARVSAVGGIILLAAASQAAPFPYIPRRIYLQLFVAAHSKKGTHSIEMVNKTGDKGNGSSNSPTADSQKNKTKQGSQWDWLNDNLFDKIEVTGSRTLGLHAYSVSGDTDAYATTTNYGEGGQTFTNNGNMTITGRKVLGFVSFQADLPDSRLSDPTTQQILLEYDRGPYKISEGDIRGSLLNDNPLVSFYKSLKGSMVEYTKGPMHLKALYSETKGSAQTVSIQGSNSVGPYYLESGKVLSDSLQVQVDGQLLKPGIDYVLNNNSADSGSITFLSRVIPATSTIVATFESVTPGTSPGVLAGVAGSYNLGKYGKVGATFVEQRATGTSGDGTVPDLFVFAGASSTTYMLSYEPIVSTVTVLLGDRPLVAGTYTSSGVVGDYAFNPVEPRQLILNSVLVAAPNATLYVRYRPIVTQSVSGDRQVFGLDYQYKFGNKGSIQYDQALGRTVNTSDPTSAIARTLSSNYLLGPVNLTATVKDIPTNFVSIETEGFSRNERSYTVGAEVKKPLLTYGVSVGNSMVDNQTTTVTTSGTSTSTIYNSRSTVAKAYATYSAADGVSWTLSQTRTAGHEIYDSQLDSTAFTGTKSFGKQLRVDSGVEYQQGKGPLVDSAGDTEIGDISLVTYHVGATYSPLTRLSVVGKVSVSSTRALGETVAGDDIQLSSTWRPSDMWSLSVSAINSSSGQSTALSGFTNGTGYGYSGNGFSSGALGSGYLGAADGQLNTRTAMAEYRASSVLSLNTHFSENRSTGTLATNSDVKGYGVGSQLTIGGGLTVIDLSLDRTNSEFIDTTTAGSSNNTSVSTTVTGSPKGRWSYQVSVNTLITGGSSTFQQNSFDYSLSLGYQLAKKHRLSASYIKGTYTGYNAQEDDQFVLAYTYTIFQRLGLTGSYRMHKVSNEDPTVTTGAYRANSFDLELSYGFRT